MAKRRARRHYIAGDRKRLRLHDDGYGPSRRPVDQRPGTTMSGFGVRTAYGSLERVIVHRPGSELEKVTPETLREFHFARPVDRKKFVADYDAMLALLRKHGVETLLLADVLAGDDDSLAY